MRPDTEVPPHSSRGPAVLALLAWCVAPLGCSSSPPAAAPPATEAAAPVAAPVTTPTTLGATTMPAPLAGSPAPATPAPKSPRPAAAPTAVAVAAAPPLPPAAADVPEVPPPGTLPAPEAPPAPVPPAERSFVPGRTVVENVRPIGRDLDKFDTRGLLIRRAPEVLGRLEFEVEPPRVDTGQPYAVRVYLANEGQKEIKLDDVGVITFNDNRRATRSVKARTGKAEPGQRVLVTELKERAAASSWAIEVTVISKRKDVYRNSLVWK